MIPHHWKRAPADNGAADPNADVRPGQFASTVLGSIRGLMATGAAARDDAIGELVATIGTSTTNVYSVSSNEGLIDIATGVNNVPSAISTPFLLRLSFDTTLAGASGTPASGSTAAVPGIVPHLMVDNFDCGPIQRRDGSALADGDLVKGRVVLVLGDMALSTDTKVTRVRVLDLTPGELGAAVAAAIAAALQPADPTRVARFSLAQAVAISQNVDALVPVSGSLPPWASSITNGVITILTPGIYMLRGLVIFTTVGDTTATVYFTARVYKNGSPLDFDTVPTPTSANTAATFWKTIFTPVFLAAGDTIALYGATSPGGGNLATAQFNAGSNFVLARVA